MITNQTATRNVVDATRESEQLTFARRLAREATGARSAIADEGEWEFMMWVPQAWAALGDCDTAIQIIESARDDTLKDLNLMYCVYSKITSGDLDDAEQIAGRLQYPNHEAGIQSKIIAARVRSGEPVDWERIQKIVGAVGSDEAFQTVALSCVGVQDFASARQIAKYMTGTAAKTTFYTSLIEAQLSCEDFTGARVSAVAFAEATLEEDSDSYKADLVSLQARAGDFDRAWRSIAEIRSTNRKVWLITKIVQEYVARGNQKAALDAVAGLCLLIEESTDTEDRLLALNGLGIAQRAVGFVREANLSFETAMLLAEELEDIWKIINLQNVVLARAQAGDFVGARQTARRMQHFDPGRLGRHAAPFQHIAEEQMNVGDKDGACETLLQASDLLHDLEEAQQAEMLALLVADLSGYGFTEDAQRIADQIRVPAKRCAAFCNVATAQAESGDLSQARTTLNHAVEAAKQPCDSHTISGLIVAQAKVGDFQGAEKTTERLKQVIREEVEAAMRLPRPGETDVMEEIDDAEDRYASMVVYHFAETAFKLGRYGELFAGRIGG